MNLSLDNLEKTLHSFCKEVELYKQQSNQKVNAQEKEINVYKLKEQLTKCENQILLMSNQLENLKIENSNLSKRNIELKKGTKDFTQLLNNTNSILKLLQIHKEKEEKKTVPNKTEEKEKIIKGFKPILELNKLHSKTLYSIY
jgi:hypothetical protein